MSIKLQKIKWTCPEDPVVDDHGVLIRLVGWANVFDLDVPMHYLEAVQELENAKDLKITKSLKFYRKNLIDQPITELTIILEWLIFFHELALLEW